LAHSGKDIHVWCAQPSYSGSKRKQKKKVIYDLVNIIYLASTRFNKNDLIGRVVNYLTFSFSLFYKLFFSKDIFPICFVTNPPFLGIIVYIICKIKKRKNIYIIHDIEPEGLVRLNILKENSFLVRIWNLLNKKILRSVEKIVCIGRDMSRFIATNYPENLEKINYIPNWQNKDLIRPILFKNNPFVKQHNLSDKFVIQYAGNMGLWHDMKIFAELAKYYENTDIYFCFVGDGMRKKEMFDVWGNQTPSNVLLLPLQNINNLSNMLSGCHIALISLRKELSGIAVPCKLYGILAAGIPVIAQVPCDSEVAIVIKEEKCGVVVEPQNLPKLIEAIAYLKDNKSVCQQMAYNARKAFEEKYTLNIIAGKYIKLIKEFYGE
jgi:glycosyltransferase involved in cell wall biosynthesis